MSFTRERIDEIIDFLRGTCLTLAAALEDDEDGEDEDLTAGIDAEIFECAGCGWWCEQSEAHEGPMGDVCDDCHGESHEDDD
jgi:hypothetical protein